MKFARFVLFTIERLEVVEATLARNLALELFEFIEAHPCGVLPEFTSALFVNLPRTRRYSVLQMTNSYVSKISPVCSRRKTCLFGSCFAACSNSSEGSVRRTRLRLHVGIGDEVGRSRGGRREEERMWRDVGRGQRTRRGWLSPAFSWRDNRTSLWRKPRRPSPENIICT